MIGLWPALLAVVLIVLTTPMALGQDRFDAIRGICFDELVKGAAFPPVPVGCKLIDCCPGCPGGRWLDWRVRLLGDVVDAVTIEFEGLSPDATRRLTIEGNGRWIDGGRLKVERGETLVRGLPRFSKGVPPVGIPRLSPSRKALETIRAGNITGWEPVPQGNIDFSIEQLLGAVVVNEFRARYRLIPCRPPVVPFSDTIRLNNNTSSDNAIVPVDGRRAPGCFDHDMARGVGDIHIPNVLSRGSCRSELIVFGANSALQLIENPPWTDGPGDRLDVNLTPRLQMPVTVWIVWALPNTPAQVLLDAERADQLYGTMNCGIQVVATVTDATANPNALSLLDRRCDQAGTLRSGIGFTSGRLNVYYIREPRNRDDEPGRGAWCGGLDLVSSPTDDDKNTILVSTGEADNETLAHEIGHALSLRHTNAVTAIPATNIMHSPGSNRDSLTEGQCFRCNVEAQSALNRNGVRVGPTRPCPHDASDAACPVLSWDEPN